MPSHYHFTLPDTQEFWDSNTFEKTTLIMAKMPKNYQRFFPERSAILGGFLGILDKQTNEQHARYDNHLEIADRLAKKLIDIPESVIFIMGATDPFCLAQDQILDITATIGQRTKKKIIWLNGDCRYYNTLMPDSVYFPFWLAIKENFEQPPQQRSFRFSCLNRRPAAHRDRLLNTLNEYKLLSSDLDVWSIRYTADLGMFATHPDDWPNDHGIAHPAYQAHLNIVTETTPWERGIITEKTTKIFESETAGIIYNSPASIEVLRGLGFEIDYVTHASLDDITPIVNLLTQLQDPKDCESWYWQHIKHHQHNRQQLISSAWVSHFEPWFKQQLANI
jgi:hypothetical protein